MAFSAHKAESRARQSSLCDHNEAEVKASGVAQCWAEK